MEELSLQNNPLTLLASYAFSGLQHIQYLNLGYNRIQSIEPNAFAGEYFFLLPSLPSHISAFFLGGSGGSRRLSIYGVERSRRVRNS